jgi:hypothetical protein
VRPGEAVLLGTASAVFLAGGALVGMGLAETPRTQDIWTNVWFDLGLPLLVLALAMGVHAIAMVHRRTLPPAANSSDGPNGEIPRALAPADTLPKIVSSTCSRSQRAELDDDRPAWP